MLLWFHNSILLWCLHDRGRWNIESFHWSMWIDTITFSIRSILGRMLAKFNQLKRNKRFNISLCWYVQESVIHIAAGSYPVQKAWGTQGSLCRGKIQSAFSVVENHTNRFLLLLRFRKNIVRPVYDVPFRSYWRKGQIFGSTVVIQVKNAPILLVMVSKCSSC